MADYSSEKYDAEALAEQLNTSVDTAITMKVMYNGTEVNVALVRIVNGLPRYSLNKVRYQFEIYLEDEFKPFLGRKKKIRVTAFSSVVETLGLDYVEAIRVGFNEYEQKLEGIRASKQVIVDALNKLDAWDNVIETRSDTQKHYDNIMFTGRMQHIHLGHIQIIAQALQLADKVLIVLGSAQESGTIRNPFSAETRAQLIRDHFPDAKDRLIILLLDDYTNENDHCHEWGRYLLDHAEAALDGEKIQCMIYGNDEVRQDWFAPEDQAGIDNIIIPHVENRINATQVRKYLAIDLYQNWSMDVPTSIHKRYQALREELLQVEFYRDLAKAAGKL